MKIITLLSNFAIIVICISVFSCHGDMGKEKTTSEQEMPKVAILGMLHFVSKNNTVSQTFNEVSSAKRQDEIKDLVNLLKRYRPTKIAIERPYRSDQELNTRYRDYLNGKYELTAEETDQIAFRLGKELKHTRLYLVYHPVEYAFDSAVAFAKDNGQTKIIDAIVKNARELAEQYDSLAENKTIKDAIYYLNTEEAIHKNHYGYLLLSQIGNDANKIGADAVGDWYKSNIKVFENIRQLANGNSDRVLVIYGQGHGKILNQLISDSPELELVRINEYLK